MKPFTLLWPDPAVRSTHQHNGRVLFDRHAVRSAAGWRQRSIGPPASLATARGAESFAKKAQPLAETRSTV